MTTKYKFISIVLWLAAVVSPVGAICGSDMHYGTAPVFTYQGTYQNGWWGYAIQIPKGYKGASFSDPGANQHGINIVLSPKAEIYVNGQANSLEEETGDAPMTSIGYSIFRLNIIRQYATEIRSYQLRKANLGRLNGTYYIVSYMCSGLSELFIEEAIIAVTPDKSPVYDITLQTTAKRYKKDHELFNQVVSRWHLIPRE